MKLYLFECGILRSYKHFFTFAVDVGKEFNVPVPFVLIDHPKGKVLFDTGNALEVVDGKEAHWGGILAAYDPVMTKEQWCVNAVRSLGISPDDIGFVILSHLHLDHAGGVGQFPKAKYIVQRDEIHYALTPDSFMRGAYIRKDFDKQVDWFFLNGWEDDKFDLFGDGSIVTYFTPGHTPGHQSLMVNLPKTGKLFFAADSCYTDENIEKNLLPGLAWNFGDCERTMQRIRHLRDEEGARIVAGHDPEAWKQYKQAPAFYE
ncbi:MAG: N-acyl homoserine lactonase family protein [Desulfovibrio sp.]|jgi:glyoxylase-like metal-dependent hydrolase (beta-lactamase superfamily II)|nr:N-acyl homoserine lactonase family protein [Desulfovibrio sp.]